MIAIARKNISRLFLNPNSFLLNSNFLSIHLFSTSRVRRLIPSPEIYDVLFHKHHFSPELASLAASLSPPFRIPIVVDSVLLFLKEFSFTNSQLEKIVIYDPRILGFIVEDLKFKFKVFQDLGLSPEEIAKMMVQNTAILHSSMVNRIIPRLSTLKGLLGSNHDVARLLRKSAWFVRTDLDKTLMPNVEILKSCGIPVERVLHFLHTYPRGFLIKSDIMRKSVDRAIEMGVSKTSVVFMHAVSVFHSTSEGMWEVKLQTLRDLGFSDNDIFSLFRKYPAAFSVSGKKMKNAIGLLLATGKYNISNIVSNPSSLTCSIEKRLEPRLQILRLLESRNLIQKWPALGAISTITDDKFFGRFIGPYYNEIGKEHIIKIYVGGRKR